MCQSWRVSSKSRSHGQSLVIWLVLGAVAIVFGAVFFGTFGQAKERYEVAHASGGTPGVATAGQWVSTGRGTFCVGRFRPDRTRAPASDRVKIHGLDREECTPGETVRARLLKGDEGGSLNSDDWDEAFTAGGEGWVGPAVVATLFGVLTLLVGIPWALLTLLVSLTVLAKVRGRSGQTGDSQ